MGGPLKRNKEQKLEGKTVAARGSLFFYSLPHAELCRADL